MDRPCCRGVVRSKDDLKGTKVATASTQVYLATPSTPNKLGIVIINDIFGFDIPNTLYVADHYAAHGFLTAVPDVFRGDSWPATEFEISEPLSGDKWGAWWGKYGSDAYVKGDLLTYAQSAIELLKSNGAEKIAVVGFCWGGMAAGHLAATGLFGAAVSIHGAGHSADQALAAKAPMLFISVDNDPYFPQEVIDAIVATGTRVNVVKGWYHGFAVRGDFANNAALKAAADQVHEDTMEFVKATLA
eukprot:m.80259 g.80259  ORF g.80259 m.80259 type:complete len:245 (-) comp50686_c0_seq2:89-823(-)